MSVTPDPWQALRGLTLARIALGRSGASQPTLPWLRFAEAHALARDAVHEPLEVGTLAAALERHGFELRCTHSAAADRGVYLRRPDLGRRLAEGEAVALRAGGLAADSLVVVIADGLSARAAQRHALPLLLGLRTALEAGRFGATPALGPVVIATQGRVALGDGIGDALGARAVLVLLGERPGLSSPDSLGAYLSWAGAAGLAGTPDAARNCVSNIRPEGQPPAQAAWRLAWLLAAAARLGATGVVLKDESDAAIAAIGTAHGPLAAMAGQIAGQSGP